jgi:hypothetical protein
MAEFKLGRIRFVWKNTWAGSTTYYKDDVVRYGGKTYICLVGNTSSAATNGFYSDVTAGYWQLAADGQAWTGTWVAATVYKIGDLVKYGGTVYQCNLGHQAGSTLEADQSKWDTWATSFNYTGAWVAATVYKVNDIITYGASVYRCNTGHTAAATNTLGLEADQSKWDIVNQSFYYAGAWSSSSVRYRINDVVKYGAGLWICTTYHTSTTAGFATVNFSRLVDGLEFANSWSNSTAYAVGDVVTYGGYTYVAKQTITTANLSVTSGTGTGTTVTINFASQSIAPFVVGQSVTVAGTTGTLAVTSASGSAGIVTLVFATQTVPPFQNGQTITVSGVSNNGYNGTYTVTGVGTGSVSYTNATTAAATGGSITVQGYNGSVALTGATASSVSFANTNIIPATGGTITNSPPTTNTGSWGLLSTGFSLLGAWTTATSYKIGQVVTFGAYTYLVILDHTSSATNIPPNNTYYTVLNPGMRWTTYSTAASYVSPSNTTTSGTGSGATFTIGVNGTAYTVTKTGNGTGYSTGATIKILGTAVGGLSPANDIIITVSQTGGAITTFTFTGTSVTWYSGSAYVLGDQATMGYNSYICILAHTAATGNRPDADTTGTYWNQVSAGAETNVMTTQGDIVYFGGAGATRLPVGTDGQVLKIVGTTPTWATFGAINNVYYVAPNGTDNYSTGYGITLDKPFATIKYACGIVAAGTNNPNASALLTKNKAWMQAEMWYWSQYQCANNTAPFSTAVANGVGFSYTKSIRDSGFIIDGVIYDLSRGGNSQTVANTLAFFQPGTTSYINSAVQSEINYFTAMLTQLLSLMGNALGQSSPAQNYQSLQTAPNPVSQVTSGSAAEGTASAYVTTLMGYLTTALTTPVTGVAALPSRSNGQSATIFIKTGTYNEAIPISVPENCSLVGDELRTTVVQPSATTATVVGFIGNGQATGAGTTLSITSVSSGSVVNGMWLQAAGVIASPTQISAVNVGTLNSASSLVAASNATGSVGSVSGTGPWTATVSGLSSTTNYIIGAGLTGVAGTAQAISGTITSTGAGAFTLSGAPSFILTTGMTVIITGTQTGTASNLVAGTYTISTVSSQTSITLSGMGTVGSGTVVGLTFTAQPGALFGGSPSSVVVTSITASSVTYLVTGGTTPVAGTAATITQTNYVNQLSAGASSASLTVGGVLSGGAVTSGTYITGQIFGASGTAVVSTTSSGVSGTSTITVASNSNIAIGQFVSGNGAQISVIPPNTYVTGITGTTITLSNALTGTLTSTAVYFFTAGGAGLYGINQTYTGTPTATTSYTVTLSQFVTSNTLTLNYTSGNMFYMRNGCTMRNMTFQGLTGTLNTANSYGTQRPTAGAYASLDPGAGPNDTSVWIFNRSPYVQNVTTFGTGCVGLKIDAALHNGGNQSIVANDFTQVLSDGIGAWVTNLGRSELVSVFTYYNHIGYLCENGGKIRATNGNNSYGLYGSVAEGVNVYETPITATVNNRAGVATTGLIVNNASGNLVRVEYANAGNNYSSNFMISSQATTYAFNGGNNDAVALADETRDAAIFETRIITSGLGYTYQTNTPQTGDTATITLAATDTATSGAYVGLRIIVNSGTGVGQYGYIANYNAGSKIALVARETFAPITVTNTTTSTNVLTIASTVTLYAGMPVVFTGTAYTGSLLSTLTTYYVVSGTITGTTFQVASTSAGALAGSANALPLGTTSGSTFILNAAGWDTMIPGTAVVATLDTTSTYQVESRITFPAPSFSYTPGTIGLASWASVTYGNGYYVAVAGNAAGTSIAGYSTNGTTWTSSATLPAVTNWSSVIAGVISGSWYYVAVATGSASSAYSINGTSWASATGLPVGNWNCIAYGNSGTTGYFMTVNSGNNGCYISTTGSSWTVTGNLPSSSTWSCLAYGTGPKIWVTLAGGATATNVFAYSINNGTTWTAGTLPVSANWTSIAWGNNRFVAVAQGSTQVIYSTNGTTWTQSPTGLITSYAWNNVKYGQGSFMATATTLSPTVSNTSAGNNLITLSSTTGIATGQSLIPTAVTQSTTASATTSAIAVTNNNSIISGTVFTPGQVNYGTFASGMTLSGTGVYATNSIAVISVSGNGTNVVYTFATQSIIPFQVNQSITVQGILPTGYNGTFAVTNATINTVTVANTTIAATTALGTITSNPTYITASNTFTSTASTIVGTTLTVGGTITGTVSIGQYLSGVTWTNNFAQIIGTTLSLAGITTGTVATNQYVAGYQATNTNAANTYVTSGTTISTVVTPTFTGQVSAGTAITFTGYTIGNILYVTSAPSSTGIVVGMTLAGTGITGGTYIVSNINGAATTTGSWVINLAQTVATSGSAIALTATPVLINISVNSGTILPGTVISGSTGIPTAQNLNIAGITGNGITVSVTYATQGAAPFIAGQSITISGVTGAGSVYNGVWTVSGATTSLVQFSSALSVTSGAVGFITSAGAFICANGSGSGATGTYYVACSNQLSTASLSLIGTYYTVNNSQTVLQTSTINGNQTVGYITLLGTGSGGAGTYTVSTSFAIASPQSIAGISYTVNQSQTVSATQITGQSNVITVAASGTTGMTVGETVVLTGGATAVTPTLIASTTSTNALTLGNGTSVTAGSAFVPTAVTYTPTITNTSPVSNQVVFSGGSASSFTNTAAMILSTYYPNSTVAQSVLVSPTSTQLGTVVNNQVISGTSIPTNTIVTGTTTSTGSISIAAGTTVTFTGSITGNTLTVTGAPTGTGLQPGMVITNGSGLVAGTFIVSNISGTPTGASSTWSVNVSNSVTAITTAVPYVATLTSPTGFFYPGMALTGGTATGSPYITGQATATTAAVGTGTANSGTSGTTSMVITGTGTGFAVGQLITGTGILNNTYITSVTVASNTTLTISQALYAAASGTYNGYASAGAGTYYITPGQTGTTATGGIAYNITPGVATIIVETISGTIIQPGMSFVPTAVTQSITASATVNATTSLTSSTINAAGVLTTGGGAPQVGMVLTGTGMQVAQNIVITGVSGSGSAVTVSYATQGSIPFLAGQLITIQGMAPAAYNGTFIVTGSPSTTQVQFNSNATGAVTAYGNVISLPTYIVSGSATTWQVNWTTGAAQGSLTTFTGTANLITVNSATNLVIGSQFTTPGTGTFGNLVPNTAYYITAIAPSTNQISVATTYSGTTNVTLTNAAASWTAIVGQNMGGLNSGTTYYIATLTNNLGNSSTAGTQYHATLSTSPTLTPVLPVGWSAGAYTSVVGGVLGGTTPVITSTASGGNLLQLSNTNNIVLGQIITPVAVTQTLSVTSTVNASASLTTSTISTAGILTVGAGTPIPGMILTGTGVQTATNTATTAITGNGTTGSATVAATYIVGQLITIQGAVPASWNGTYAVVSSNGTTTTFANTTLLTATVQGIVISQPTYVLNQITATTWQTSLYQAGAVASTTITGTANLAGVNSVNNIVAGQTFVAPGSGTFGGITASQTYYVKAVVPQTNQISLSTTYFGGDATLTGTVASPTTGSFTVTSAATYGSLTSGTPYYVSSIPAPGYVTLATNATLTSAATLSMGNGQWTITSNGVIGGINSGQVYYVVSGGASTTISPNPSLTPVLQLTSGTATWSTSVGSSFGGLAYSAGAVANYYVTEIISSTQMAISTGYFGANSLLTTATGGSVTVTAGANFGGLTSGTTYYVASITGNQVALSTSATLTPTITVTNGNNAWTSVIGTTSTAAATSSDGINWIVRSMPSNSWSGVVFGNPGNVPKWALVATNSTTSASIPNFTPAQARIAVTSNAINSIRIVEPGSGYLSVPTPTVVDPNITSTASLTPRIGTGVLANPSFTNRGTGFSTANASITSLIGYADSYQVGQYFNVQNMPSLPTAGSNVILAGNTQVYKLVLYSSAVGSQATFTGYISGTTLYVTATPTGTITTGMYLQTFGVTTPVYISANLTGTGNGISTWTISNTTNGNIGSSTATQSIIGGTYSATLQVNPLTTTTTAPAHGDLVTMRILFSQVRLTGHDFLSIGTGNIVTTNYPNTPTQPANTNNQTVQNGGGRVFFTSTDQDGNFNVGNLFSVQQSTGVATLNANAFNLAGLQTLSLGSVALGNSNTIITQFSTDGTFSSNSDNIVPTQKAIRTYINSQIGGGASSINVNTLIAGQIQITGNTISNTNNTQINVRNKMYFKQGIDGSPLALNYFLLK